MSTEALTRQLRDDLDRVWGRQVGLHSPAKHWSTLIEALNAVPDEHVVEALEDQSTGKAIEYIQLRLQALGRLAELAVVLVRLNLVESATKQRVNLDPMLVALPGYERQLEILVHVFRERSSAAGMDPLGTDIIAADAEVTGIGLRHAVALLQSDAAAVQHCVQEANQLAAWCAANYQRSRLLPDEFIDILEFAYSNCILLSGQDAGKNQHNVRLLPPRHGRAREIEAALIVGALPSLSRTDYGDARTRLVAAARAQPGVALERSGFGSLHIGVRHVVDALAAGDSADELADWLDLLIDHRVMLAGHEPLPNQDRVHIVDHGRHFVAVARAPEGALLYRTRDFNRLSLLGQDPSRLNEAIEWEGAPPASSVYVLERRQRNELRALAKDLEGLIASGTRQRIAAHYEASGVPWCALSNGQQVWATSGDVALLNPGRQSNRRHVEGDVLVVDTSLVDDGLIARLKQKLGTDTRVVTYDSDRSFRPEQLVEMKSAMGLASQIVILGHVETSWHTSAEVGLVLSASRGGESGSHYLTAEDVASLNLSGLERAWLLGCESSRASAAVSQSALSHAFSFAGAGSVIASTTANTVQYNTDFFMAMPTTLSIGEEEQRKAWAEFISGERSTAKGRFELFLS